ncbi:MAG: type II toxin-antitoxin system VapC family toxin [Micromonosporaceae bacterium]
MPVLVDSTVLLDLSTADSTWGMWARETIAEVADRSVLVINQVIFAEASARFDRIEDFDASFPTDLFRRETVPFQAAFLAGKCQSRYRRLGGARDRTLPGFFIGAHAAIAGYRLLTRDAKRYRTYFPKLALIAPN